MRCTHCLYPRICCVIEAFLFRSVYSILCVFIFLVFKTVAFLSTRSHSLSAIHPSPSPSPFVGKKYIRWFPGLIDQFLLWSSVVARLPYIYIFHFIHYIISRICQRRVTGVCCGSVFQWVRGARGMRHVCSERKAKNLSKTLVYTGSGPERTRTQTFLLTDVWKS